MAQQASPSPLMLTSHTGTGSCFSCFTSDPAPYTWPGKAEDDDSTLWDPTLVRKLEEAPDS